MKIYVAARYSRFKEMQGYRDQLHALGHVVTSRWIDGDHQIDDAGLSSEAKEEERVRFAQEDLTDLVEADWVISFTEKPRSSNSRGGRHVEFGMAVALEKRVVVIGFRENVFHCLPQVEFFETWAAFAFAESSSDDELLRRAVRDCRRGRGRGKIPLWFAVSHRFALGSTYSMLLCRRFDLDPEEMVKG